MRYDLDPEAVAKALRLPPEQIAAWRHGFIKPAHNGRPRGKPKRPKGYLTVREVFDQYGIPPKILSAWREEGMPFKLKHTMILVKEEVLAVWIEKKKATF